MKILSAILLAVASFSASFVYSEPYQIIKDQNNIPILSPAFAERKTAKLILENGLHVYLISDPQADLSAAALSVNAGSWLDPKEIPGLAHFLEHMLFLGTKKFPKESSFDSFVKENGGETNAFTGSVYTTFAFDIHDSAFPEALDRFSQFFKEPLFNESGVLREMNAVHQEYQMNIDNDDMRQFFVYRALVNPEHPEHKFNIGNLTTLAKADTQMLREWFNAHYSANLMQLAVYSKLPLEELQKLVLENFSQIPNTNKPKIEITLPIENAASQGKFVYITPVKDLRQLTLIWDLPGKYAKMLDTKPDEVICYILGDEGKNSLLRALQQEGFAEKLTCASYRRNHYFTLFLQIDLTEKGVEEPYQVVERVFQQIAYLKETGVPKYIFDDVQKIDTISYQYPSRENPFDSVIEHVQAMKDEPLETYPQKSKIPTQYDAAALKEFFSYLTPRKALYFLAVSPDLSHVAPDQKEPWLGVPYAVVPVSEPQLKKWEEAKPDPNITMPAPNPFIPEHLKLVTHEVKQPETLIPQPRVLTETSNGKLYFAQDDRYFIPEISWSFALRSAALDAGNPRSVALTDLYVKSLNEALNEFSYPAKVAGLEYTIERKENWIQIVLNGHSENAAKLFNAIIDKLKTSMPSPTQFNLIKTSQLVEYNNALRATPFERGVEYLKEIIYEKFSSTEEKVAALKSITYTDLEQHFKALFEKAHVEGVMIGNMTEQDAMNSWKPLLAVLNGKPYPRSEWNFAKVAVLPEDQGPFYIIKEIPSGGNLVLLAIELDRFSATERGLQQILSTMMQQPFFAELRTRQQTGYMVFHANEELEKRLFLFFIVESHRFEPRDLLSRIELFIENFAKELRLDKQYAVTFDTIKQAQISNLTQPARNLSDMGELLMTLAFKYNGNFEWINTRVKALQELTFTEFLPRAQEILSPYNRRRLAVLLKGNVDNEGILQYKEESIQQLREKLKYLSSQQVLQGEESNDP
jgi:insulysin